jgi:hypothetical protein
MSTEWLGDKRREPASDLLKAPDPAVQKCPDPVLSGSERTSRGRVKRVVTLPALFASGAMPPTVSSSYPWMSLPNGDKRGLDEISGEIGSSQPEHIALYPHDNSEGEGAGAADEQVGIKYKKLRSDGEDCNLSRREEHKTVMAVVRRIEEMEYEEQAAKAGPWSSGLKGRVGHGSEKVGGKRRFRDACDTGWGEEGPRGEGVEKLKDKKRKVTKHKQEGERGKGKEEAVEKRKRLVSDAGGTAKKKQRAESVGGAGAGGVSVIKRPRPANNKQCEHNRRRNRCKECGGGDICEHNRQKSQCKECGGASICEHNRRRVACMQCGGSSMCEHNRERRRCKQCGGSSICEHNRQRHSCKECGGSSICEHNRRRGRCKECGGSSICEHDRIRSGCKQCGGASICEHNRIRSVCKQCGGASICEHNRERTTCKQCGGSSICEHNRKRYSCKECGGSSICEHNRIRRMCKQCGGSGICEHKRERRRCKDCQHVAHESDHPTDVLGTRSTPLPSLPERDTPVSSPASKVPGASKLQKVSGKMRLYQWDLDEDKDKRESEEGS